MLTIWYYGSVCCMLSDGCFVAAAVSGNVAWHDLKRREDMIKPTLRKQTGRAIKLHECIGKEVSLKIESLA